MEIKDFKLGATGRFPRGHADADDEGEITMALAADHGNGIVRMEFGKPVGWLGLASQDARCLAAMLYQKADEIDRRKA